MCSKKITPFLLVLAGMLIITSCGSGNADQNQAKEQIEEASKKAEAAMDSTVSQDQLELGPEYTSAFVCPMHCAGSGSAEPGKCPACGMDYVENETKTSPEDGHDHEDHGHEGHDHGQEG